MGSLRIHVGHKAVGEQNDYRGLRCQLRGLVINNGHGGNSCYKVALPFS